MVSDGKEYGSKATYRDVLRYLETNNIAVWGTLVGDSARWGEGYVSRFHLPFTMYDNMLAKYIFATGGQLDSERGVNGIETSYAKIAEEARNQYTLVYASHESVYDSKFRNIDVRVDRPGLEVIAKRGYYPSAEAEPSLLRSSVLRSRPGADMLPLNILDETQKACASRRRPFMIAQTCCVRSFRQTLVKPSRWSPCEAFQFTELLLLGRGGWGRWRRRCVLLHIRRRRRRRRRRIIDALQAFFKTLKSFAQTLAQLRQPLGPKQQKRHDGEHDQVPWLQ